MENKKNFYIGGKWVTSKSKQEIKVINPATEENCAVISLGNKEDVDYAVSSAKKAYGSWAFSTKDERIKNLMQSIDNTNYRYGRSTISLASAGINKKWSMRRQYSSKIDTADFYSLPKIVAN